MITRDEILMGREVEYPLSEELEANLTALLVAVNKLRTLYNKPMIVSSGYRPGTYNSNVKGAKDSAHIVCLAVDFKDIDGDLSNFCTVAILEQCGLYRETRFRTPSWCHVQIRPTQHRIFIP